MSRKTAREDAFKLLFEWEFRPDSLEEILAYYHTLKTVSDEESAYIHDIATGVSAHHTELDEKIAAHAKGWHISRIAKVSLAALRLCVYEMLYREDIPVSVSISEALEIVEKYEGEEAKPFVNGILGAIDQSLTQKIPEKE